MRILACGLLVACGGGSPNKPIVLLDSSFSDSAPDTAPLGTNVQLQTFGTAPLFLALRDGPTGTWAPLLPSATSFNVTKATYQLLAVCANGTAFETGIAAQAVADGMAFMPCFDGGSGGTPPTTVAITGQMAQAGSVWMYDSATGTNSPWNYTLQVTPDTHDLIAADATKIAIQRGLTITAAATEPTLDVEATGTAFDSQTIALTGLGNGTLANDVTWFTANEDVDRTGTGATVNAIPATLFDLTTDFEIVDITATDGTKSQGVQEFSQDATFETPVTLPPELSGVTFSNAMVQWTTLPSFDQFEFVVAAENYEVIQATTGYLGAAT
jgi:hypothetical protein